MKKVIAITLASLASCMMIQTVEAEAPITSDEAKDIALKNVHGKIVNVGLEHEDGKLVYDVDMQVNHAPLEVIINATTGKVMALKKEFEH